MIKRPALAVLLLASLLGCKHGPTVVGDWTTTGVGAAGNQTIHFGSGGDFRATAEIDEPGVTLTGKFTITIDGTYVLKDDAFTMTVTHSKASGLKPQYQALVDSQTSKLDGNTQKGKLEWKNDDQFVVTADKAALKPGMPASMTFDRKK